MLPSSTRYCGKKCADTIIISITRYTYTRKPVFSFLVKCTVPPPIEYYNMLYCDLPRRPTFQYVLYYYYARNANGI